MKIWTAKCCSVVALSEKAEITQQTDSWGGGYGGGKNTNIILKHQTLFKLLCQCLYCKSSSLKTNFQTILTLYRKKDKNRLSTFSNVQDV